MAPRNISYEPVRDIFQAMLAEQINGVPLSDVIGGGDPEQVASEVLTVMTNYVHLSSQGTVLEVGCGCGRIAAALTQHLQSGSRYVGVDIVSGLVEFGRKFITPRYPQFKFLLLDQGNFTYDAWRSKGGLVDLEKLSQAQPQSSVDLAISISLFTHLDYAPALEILNAIRWMLGPKGQAFITVFVLDDKAREGIHGSRSCFGFSHRTPSGKLHSEKLEDPTYAVAYEIGQLEELVQSAGLTLDHWIRGYWSSGDASETFQDALLLRKA
ncbi:MAG: class I SAM-dependent methyltransferase [Chthoniobacterales bacterium]